MLVKKYGMEKFVGQKKELITHLNMLKESKFMHIGVVPTTILAKSYLHQQVKPKTILKS